MRLVGRILCLWVAVHLGQAVPIILMEMSQQNPPIDSV